MQRKKKTTWSWFCVPLKFKFISTIPNEVLSCFYLILRPEVAFRAWVDSHNNLLCSFLLPFLLFFLLPSFFLGMSLEPLNETRILFVLHINSTNLKHSTPGKLFFFFFNLKNAGDNDYLIKMYVRLRWNNEYKKIFSEKLTLYD